MPEMEQGDNEKGYGEMRCPGGKYLIGFRKIKSICLYHKLIEYGKYLCSHKDRKINNYFCKENSCPVIKTLPELRR
jgi:hypothetical protein